MMRLAASRLPSACAVRWRALSAGEATRALSSTEQRLRLCSLEVPLMLSSSSVCATAGLHPVRAVPAGAVLRLDWAEPPDGTLSVAACMCGRMGRFLVLPGFRSHACARYHDIIAGKSSDDYHII
jgi:hypothetical protein